MSPSDLIVYMRKRPFEPLRFHLSDGSSYDVRHPDMAIVTQTEVHIGVGGNDDLPAVRIVYCDPYHITRVEPIPAAPRPKPRSSRR